MNAHLRTWAVLAFVLALSTPPHAPAWSQQSAKPAGLAIGSGAVTGVYFQAANAMCRLISRRKAQSPDQIGPCAATLSAGSIANVEALRSRAINIGLIQSDVLAEAVNGTDEFKDRPAHKLRVLFSLYTEPFQLLVQSQLRLRAFADLKGRKINIGPPGTTENQLFSELFKLHDLNLSSFSEVETLGPTDQLSAFCEGNVEALGMTVGAPNSGFADAITHCGGALLNVDSDAVSAMLAANPQYDLTTIPAGTYPEIGKDVRTFGVLAVAVARADAPDDQIYAFVKAVFEQLDALKQMHPALAALDPHDMVKNGVIAPLHPGALRYYRERGLLAEAE